MLRIAIIGSYMSVETHSITALILK